MDRQALSEVVDQLMEKKTFPDKTPEELNVFREEKIKELDDKIVNAIFESLNNEQLAEIDQMFDNGEESPEAFTKFFENAGVDLEKVVGETTKAFSAELLGGENV